MKTEGFEVLLVGKRRGFSYSMYRYFACLRDGLIAAKIPVHEIVFEPKWTGWIPVEKLREWASFLEMRFCFSRVLKKRIASLQQTIKRPLIVHICDHSDAILWIALRDVLATITIHDCIPMRVMEGEFFPVSKGMMGRLQQRWIYGGLTRFEGLVAISDRTLADVKRFVVMREGCRVETILNGPAVPFQRLDSGEVAERLVGNEGYERWIKAGKPRLIISVGGDLFYKNRRGTVLIFRELVERYSEPVMLVSIGSKLSAEDKEGLERLIIECDRLSDLELEAWYNVAEILLFPSLAEGFGWPLIEGLQTGCLIVTTDDAPMNTVAGRGAVYLDRLKTSEPDIDWIVESARRVSELMEEDKEKLIWRRAVGAKQVEAFTRDNMIAGYEKFWSKMLRSKGL